MNSDLLKENFSRIKEIRDTSSNPFVLDVMVRFVERKNTGYNNGWTLEDGTQLDDLGLEDDVLKKGLETLLDAKIIENANHKRVPQNKGSFFITGFGKDYVAALDKHLFDGGMPAWEYLTIEQVYELASKCTLLPKTYFKFITISYSSDERPKPQTHTIDEALRLGLSTFGINQDLLIDNKNRPTSLMHFVAEYEGDNQYTGSFLGFEAKVLAHLMGEGVWRKSVEYQRQIHQASLEAARITRDCFKEKQVNTLKFFY